MFSGCIGVADYENHVFIWVGHEVRGVDAASGHEKKKFNLTKDLKLNSGVNEGADYEYQIKKVGST